MNSKIILFLGRSGSGKGTQAELLREKLDLEYSSTGDLLRARKKIDDFTGRKIAEVIDAGNFAPSSVIVKLLFDEFEKYKNKQSFSGVILDGAARKILEAQLIDQAFEWYEWLEGIRIIFIDISRHEAFRRLLKRRACKGCENISAQKSEGEECDRCGGKLVVREDDNPEAINRRQDEFEEKILSVVDYYKKDNRLIIINGAQSIEDVHKDIMKALENL